MSDTPDSFEALIERITPEVHQELRSAIELGHWSNGIKLTKDQKAHSLQLLIAWEAINLPEEERVGYIHRSKLEKVHCDD